MALMMEAIEGWQAFKSLAQCNQHMLEQQIACDVSFIVGSKREVVKAHKYVLISRSSVFQSFLCGTLVRTSSADDVIPISDMTRDTFLSLLKYLYCNEVRIDAGNVDGLLYAARKYAVAGLLKQCTDYLESRLSAENVCEILEQVHLYGENEMKRKCTEFIFANALSVLRSNGFERLCTTCIEGIIKADELVVEEKEVYTAMLRWAEVECIRQDKQVSDAALKEVLGPLLYKIRFPLISAMYFTDHVSTRQILNPVEILAIFQYYHGHEPNPQWRFNTTRRRGFTIPVVLRFGLISMDELFCANGPHVLFFTCSAPVTLHGVVLYGCLDELSTLDASVQLQDEEEGRQLGWGKNKFITNRTLHTYDLFFSKPVLLEVEKRYCVSVEMNGPPTKTGMLGRPEVTSQGVTFKFFSSPENPTCVETGQIPGLLFTLDKSVRDNT